ncbi:MAG TPA: NAD(P)-dependent oxidoreductase [Phycisphaerae bacterium]|nr:NAD(P)-dependent oxidoreductase [Phycisphaerae bacterium]
MRVAVTGASGFLGRYIVNLLLERGHECRCWFRPASDRTGFEEVGGQLEWLPGELGDREAGRLLVRDCSAVVHAALHHPGRRFAGGSQQALIEFAQKNIVGTLELIEAARQAEVPRFIFISSCAVHDRILQDRELDEFHPLLPYTHYGAHKAAIEAFVRSYGYGQGYPICALRPTGIYGLANPPEESKWFDLVRRVARGEAVTVSGGGKEVHVADVARAVELMLSTEEKNVKGEVYNCYDRYISEYDVAVTARELAGSTADIAGEQKQPLNEINTDRIRALGMQFGGWPLFEQTIGQMVDVVRGG